MSKRRNGSTRIWRIVRLRVLARDSYQCQIRIPGVCTVRAEPSGPHAGHAHHTRGAHTGLDMRYLVAACAACNLKTGDPTKAPDPHPIQRTRW